MSTYIFILGRTPDLSLAELKSVFRARNIPFKVRIYADAIALVESVDDLEIDQINKILGGTVKIGKVVEELPLSAIDEIASLFSIDVLQNEFFDPHAKKVEFGVSIYSCGGRNNIQKMYEQHTQITQQIKNVLEENGIKAHYPYIRDLALSSASVDKNKLIQKGAEILFIVTDTALIVGKTVVVQEFEAFSKRDYGRPIRDMRSGVMPPKLARMMINISESDVSQTLLDPFCGSGTLIQEALHLGYKNLIATDASSKAIRDTRDNINWYQERYQPADVNLRIEKANVKKLSSILKKKSVAAIATEPYLGPTLRRHLPSKAAESASKELMSLYVSAFQEFAEVLMPGGSVVIIFPVFPHRGSQYFLPIIKQIENLGFVQKELSDNKRKSVVVGNTRDFVQREIVKFTLR